eukprot:TRINITY_DN1056_c0_g1_i1.p1 TRINITY_DN1056_c0_g1~~TRINITY_DN1056_c0_g1_i1.p1  ORF type:complete len:703 (+),score=188.78 TRINITY_DN1056_c0_g1_i1:160-2268(+)
MTTIGTIIQDIADRPGNAVGIDAATLSGVWRSLCQFIEGMLGSKKGVSIPQFGQFTFRQQDVDAGTWGVKQSLVPVFYFLPAFCSLHGLSSLDQFKPPHAGLVNDVLLNIVSLAISANTTKDVVGNALKDLTRRIGELAGTGASVTLDFGFCRIMVRQRKYSVSWTPSFLTRVAELDNMANHASLKTSVQAKLVASNTNRGAVAKRGLAEADARGLDELRDELNRQLQAPAPGPQEVRRTHTAGLVRQALNRPARNRLQQQRAARTAFDGEVSESSPVRRPQSAKTPYYHDTAGSTPPRSAPGGSLYGDFEAPPTPVVTRPNTIIRVAPRGGPLQPPQTPQYPPTYGNSTYSATNMNTTQFSSAGDDYGAMPNSEEDLSGPQNAYRRRQRAKLRHRMQRKKAYHESWQMQAEERRKRQEEQKEEERQIMQNYHTWATEQMRKEHEKQLDLKRQARQFSRENEAVANSGVRSTPPAAHPMGDIFGHVTPPKSTAPDIQFLRRQMEEKRKLKQEERLKEKAYENRLAEREVQTWREMQEKERERKTEMQRKAAEAYEQQLREQSGAVLPGRYDDAQDYGGNFFFKDKSLDELRADETYERVERRQRLREMAKRNMEQDNQQKDLSRAQRDKQLEEDRRKADLAVRTALEQEEQNRLAARDRKAQMKRTWDKQVDEKKSLQQTQRMYDSSFQERVMFKNESSEED